MKVERGGHYLRAVNDGAVTVTFFARQRELFSDMESESGTSDEETTLSGESSFMEKRFKTRH